MVCVVLSSLVRTGSAAAHARQRLAAGLARRRDGGRLTVKDGGPQRSGDGCEGNGGRDAPFCRVLVLVGALRLGHQGEAAKEAAPPVARDDGQGAGAGRRGPGRDSRHGTAIVVFAGPQGRLAGQVGRDDVVGRGLAALFEKPPVSVVTGRVRRVLGGGRRVQMRCADGGVRRLGGRTFGHGVPHVEPRRFRRRPWSLRRSWATSRRGMERVGEHGRGAVPRRGHAWPGDVLAAASRGRGWQWQRGGRGRAAGHRGARAEAKRLWPSRCLGAAHPRTRTWCRKPGFCCSGHGGMSAGDWACDGRLLDLAWLPRAGRHAGTSVRQGGEARRGEALSRCRRIEFFTRQRRRGAAAQHRKEGASLLVVAALHPPCRCCRQDAASRHVRAAAAARRRHRVHLQPAAHQLQPAACRATSTQRPALLPQLTALSRTRPSHLPARRGSGWLPGPRRTIPRLLSPPPPLARRPSRLPCPSQTPLPTRPPRPPRRPRLPSPPSRCRPATPPSMPCTMPSAPPATTFSPPTPATSSSPAAPPPTAP